MAGSAPPDIEWRDDGPYTWPKEEGLKYQLRKIQQECPWPNTYQTQPVRIDRLATLMNRIDRVQTYGYFRTHLSPILGNWYHQQLKGHPLRLIEVMPAFLGSAVHSFRVSPLPERDSYIVAIDGTETLAGTLLNWIVYPDGSGSAAIAGERKITMFFDVHYLVLHSGCITKAQAVHMSPPQLTLPINTISTGLGYQSGA
jgi:hypothetical protein